VKNKLFILLIIILAFSSCSKEPKESYIAIINAQVLTFDKGVTFIKNQFILIKDSLIVETGDYDSIRKFPDNTHIIDAQNKFVIPGLIDGFAVINNQSYANAYLYSGVTSLIGVDGGRRGEFFTKADPGPDFYRLESIGDEQKETEAHLQDLQNLYNKGYKIALLKYQLKPDQVAACVEKAKELGMGTIGELGLTSYAEASKLKVNAFVHTTRYSLDVAPEAMRNAVAAEPFSDDMNSAKWKYYQYLSQLDLNDQAFTEHAAMLGKSKSFIMPTLSLLSLDLPESKNPWNEEIAKIIKASDINNPADKITGKHNYTPEEQKNYTAMALQEIAIETAYNKAGAKYLAGSATDVWGTMPGISLHTELELLSKIGLKNPQIIKATTVNFQSAFKWNTGKIKEGFEADLLILDKNPLRDIANLKLINTLINNGKIIDRQKLLN